MKLEDYLTPDLVVTDVRPGGIREVLRQLVDPLVEQGLLRESEELVEALLDRETLQSTGVGHGVAVPHAISDEIAAPRLVLARCPEGVDFQALDDRPVHLFFMLLSPPDEARNHIKLLARIARMVRHPEIIDELLESTDPDRLLRAVRDYDRHHV
ncbi:MAG: PTS sugar transporter subunit IIA [Gemmatimonadota bacterium]